MSNFVDIVGDWIDGRWSPLAASGILAVDLIIRPDCSLTWSDLNLFALPGLAVLGLEALLTQIGSNLGSEPKLVDGQPVESCLARFEFESQPLPELLFYASEEIEPAQRTADPALVRILAADEVVDPETCVYALQVRRLPGQLSRPETVTGTLLRWCAFLCASPQRAILWEHVERRQLCSDFLVEVAGSRKGPFCTRLRRAEKALESVGVEAALPHLKDAVLVELNLPESMRRAIVSGRQEILTDLERRDLIYLARSGPPMLKVLAADRLRAERSRNDAKHTLEQLQFDPNFWVRMAARSQ